MLPAGSKRLVILQSEVRMGDPHCSSDNRDNLSIIFSIFEPLVSYARGGRFHPVLAESWTTSQDARAWVFHLRQPVRFHNGDLLTAHDVVESLNRVRDPSMGGELGSQGVYQTYLKGAEINAIDERTIQIVTAEPFADLLDLLALFPILPESARRDPDAHCIGSGPYELIGREPGRIAMKAFEGYWGGQPPITEIEWRAEHNAKVRLQHLLAGKADLVADLGANETRQAESSNLATVVRQDSSVCTAFMCNLLSGVCQDMRVRQALNYGLDVPELIKMVMDDEATPLNGPLTALHFGRDSSVPAYPYDPAKAQRLLADAGYDSGIDLVLDIPSVLPDEAPRLAKRMAEQYERIGIRTEIKEFSDRPAYAEMVRAKQLDDACCFDSSPLSTYRLLREKFHSTAGGPWWLGYTDQSVDDLINCAEATVDLEKRGDLYRCTYAKISHDAPWIFLYNPTLMWGIGPKASGWAPQEDGLIRIM